MATDTKLEKRGADAETSLHSATSPIDDGDSAAVREKLSTLNDCRDMRRLGKLQQLRVSEKHFYLSARIFWRT